MNVAIILPDGQHRRLSLGASSASLPHLPADEPYYLLPGGLVHAHIHIDKAGLLESGQCCVGDGSFKEALTRTNEAKEKFTRDDLLARGRRLMERAVQHGVVAMRAHVEVDPTVNTLCYEAGLTLRSEFAKTCDVRLVCFAQDPIFPTSSSLSSSMQTLLTSVAAEGKVSAVGSAPYVEPSRAASLSNIDFIISLAKRSSLDVDFHIDYDLDETTEPLCFEAISRFRSAAPWNVDGRPARLTLGHATKLSVFSAEQLDRLAHECREVDVAFVGLPNSDVYMQGRDKPWKERPRGTAPLLELIKRGIPCAVDVNNVSNLFTPQGDGDPMALLPTLVGLYQSSTPPDLLALLTMVTCGAAWAAGLDVPRPFSKTATSEGDVLEAKQALARRAELDEEGRIKGDATLLQGCASLEQAVLSPPSGRLSFVNGRLVGGRVTTSFHIPPPA